MTREEIETKIAELRQDKFMNNMIDHWTAEDAKYDTELSNQIRELERKLEELQ